MLLAPPQNYQGGTSTADFVTDGIGVYHFDADGNITVTDQRTIRDLIANGWTQAAEP